MQPAQHANVSISYAWNRPYLPADAVGTYYVLLEASGHSDLTTDRAPINVSLVLDRSGSMSGSKIRYAKQACQFVVEQLSEGDTFSLVAFDDEVETIIPPGPVTNKPELRKRIERIQTGSCTNLSAGLIEGAKHVLEGKLGLPRAVNRVILLSDGLANRGVTSKTRLAELAREYHSSGASISAMGLGDGFDEELMETISYQGGGHFYYIDAPERIPVIFQQELEGMLSVVANRMTLTLRTSEHARVMNVYGYTTERRAGELKVNAGDLYANEAKAILLELAVDPHAPGRHPVMSVEWSYNDLSGGAKKACAVCCELSAEFTDDAGLLEEPGDAAVLQQVELARSAIAIESAMEALDRGDLQAGMVMLREQANHMRAMSDALTAPALAEAAEKLIAQVGDDFAYSNRTRKKLHEQKVNQLRGK